MKCVQRCSAGSFRLISGLISHHFGCFATSWWSIRPSISPPFRPQSKNCFAILAGAQGSFGALRVIFSGEHLAISSASYGDSLASPSVSPSYASLIARCRAMGSIRRPLRGLLIPPIAGWGCFAAPGRKVASQLCAICIARCLLFGESAAVSHSLAHTPYVKWSSNTRFARI